MDGSPGLHCVPLVSGSQTLWWLTEYVFSSPLEMVLHLFLSCLQIGKPLTLQIQAVLIFSAFITMFISYKSRVNVALYSK